MNRIILSAAAVFTVATAAHAGEVSDIQAQSKELREQNRALTKRIADGPRRCSKIGESRGFDGRRPRLQG